MFSVSGDKYGLRPMLDRDKFLPATVPPLNDIARSVHLPRLNALRTQRIKLVPETHMVWAWCAKPPALAWFLAYDSNELAAILEAGIDFLFGTINAGTFIVSRKLSLHWSNT